MEKSYSKWAAYGQSKFANILFAKEFDKRMKQIAKKNISAYSLHPGYIHTKVISHFEKIEIFE